MNEKTPIELIFKRKIKSESNNFVPDISDDINDLDLNSILPNQLQRKDLNIPNIPESVIVRHFIDLSQNNYCVDCGTYPLGSCTMKYNPKINEITSRLENFTKIHPLQENVEGCSELIYKLGKNLCEITGMDGFTLNPAAGAQGEHAGILIIKKYLQDHGIEGKDKIIVPDTAHGTNPASATMAGFAIIEIDSDENGELPLDKLKFAMKHGDVAGLMLTNPNTLGKFDKNILKITEIVHKYDGLCYYDGANLNPMLGICRPGDMGFDIMHVNLHKTFSTPHGGGGPGAGPVGVYKDLIKYLPVPYVIKKEDPNTKGKYEIISESKDSIGRINTFFGNFGVLIKAFTYIKGLGAAGLKKAGQNAVLNANYLRTHLSKKYKIPYDGICMHEFVIDAVLPNEVNAEDVAKRLLDYGIYAPTMYFPLIVHEAMMIEPTETETKEDLDYFIQALLNIYEEAEKNPEILKKAPHKTPIKRLDATLAARKPHLVD